jgi:hypothetical protein
VESSSQRQTIEGWKEHKTIVSGVVVLSTAVIASKWLLLSPRWANYWPLDIAPDVLLAVFFWVIGFYLMIVSRSHAKVGRPVVRTFSLRLAAGLFLVYAGLLTSITVARVASHFR